MKTTPMIESGIYAYKVLPFVLKNANAICHLVISTKFVKMIDKTMVIVFTFGLHRLMINHLENDHCSLC